MAGKIPARLQAIKDHVQATAFLNYKDFLHEVYLHLKAHEESYSYVQLAEDLGFSRTNVMYLIIKGQRSLTSKAAKKVASALGLGDVQKLYFERLVDYQNTRDGAVREELFKKLIQLKSVTLNSQELKNQFSFFNEWHHAVIYEMTFLAKFCSDPQWIADRIQGRIRPEQARKSLELLESLNLIVFDAKKNRHVPTQRRVSTPQEVQSMALTRFHQKMIELGKEALTRVEPNQRDVTAVTISIPLTALPEFKREISHFRDKLLMMADNTKDQNAVYQVNIQMFPLLKVKE